MMQQTTGIRVERAGDLATVVIDRPTRRNAVTFAMWQAIAGSFTHLAGDPRLRGVVLMGQGDDFSAGGDISDFETTRANAEQGIVYERAVDAAADAIAALGRPVIAAIRGHCFGGACHLAMACDFRFVSPDAKIAIPAAKLSIVYGARGTARLLALVGLAEAKRIFYTGAPFGADHALANGFADRVEADPAAAAAKWLAEVSALAPLSISGSKAILNGLSMPIEPFDAKAADEVMLRALTSEDYVEGRAAFAAKRPPRFRGG